jgi:hypothetical protein
MTSKQLTAALTAAGYGVAHARRTRNGEVRAYLHTPHASGAREVRWHPACPADLLLVAYATDGLQQREVPVATVPMPA